MPQSTNYSIVPNTTTVQPGEKFSYTIHYKNPSTTDSSIIIITASFDEDAIFEEAAPVGTKSDNHTYQWLVGAVQPASEGLVTIGFHLANEVQPSKCSVALGAKITTIDQEGVTAQYTVPSGAVSIPGCITPGPETETPLEARAIDTPAASPPSATPTTTARPPAAISTATAGPSATATNASPPAPTPTTTAGPPAIPDDSGPPARSFIAILLDIITSPFVVTIITIFIPVILQVFLTRSRIELSYFVIQKQPYIVASKELIRDMQIYLHGKQLQGDEVKVIVRIINSGTEAIDYAGSLDLKFASASEVFSADIIDPERIGNTITTTFKQNVVTIAPGLLNKGEWIDISVGVRPYSDVKLDGRIKNGKIRKRGWFKRRLFNAGRLKKSLPNS
ncbi:MAG TPA: hypothetical protein VGD69_06895 [Herpetosiphonaceae bacterium]